MTRKRLDPAVGSSLLTLGVIVAAGVLLSLVSVIPDGDGTTALTASGQDAPGLEEGPQASADAPGATPAAAAQGGPSAGVATGASRAGSGGAAPTSQAVAGGGAASKAACSAGANGGNTDVGVTGNSIKVAATVVADGPGSSFLGPVRVGMGAVVNRVNRAGGICGRKVNLILRNDSWEASLGQQYIKNFVEGEQVFALAVVPSSEGLRAADGYIRSKQVPVVGTDGMLIHQYRNPWIWPVATSTISTMHVMAKDAHDRGARDFAIVFDAKYHFGVEGAYAFNAAVKRLTGSDIDGYDPSLKSCTRRFCGIQPQKPSYASEANAFNNACFNSGSSTCDFIGLLLEPDTATSFIAEGRTADPALGHDGGFGLAQPLFTRSFAEDCKRLCDGMWVWTGYNPPIEALASMPGVQKYVDDIRGESVSADVSNQFLEGGYQGMSLLVDALQKAGPNLTRAGLKAVLDSSTFDSGLSSPLSWAPDNHFANTAAQAFAIQYKETFSGWRHKTGFLRDPWVGQDIPSGE